MLLITELEDWLLFNKKDKFDYLPSSSSFSLLYGFSWQREI
jgi:hypothetical protein